MEYPRNHFGIIIEQQKQDRHAQAGQSVLQGRLGPAGPANSTVLNHVFQPIQWIAWIERYIRSACFPASPELDTTVARERSRHNPTSVFRTHSKLAQVVCYLVCLAIQLSVAQFLIAEDSAPPHRVSPPPALQTTHACIGLADNRRTCH